MEIQLEDIAEESEIRRRNKPIAFPKLAVLGILRTPLHPIQE